MSAGTPPPETVAYGDHPSQFAQLWRPERPQGGTGGGEVARGRAPLAVLLHGGWWRDLHGAGLMDPIAADLAAAGWLVWNAEYRRTGTDGGGWPRTPHDAEHALAAAVRHLDPADGPADGPAAARTVVVIGHSAGGHLAALLAAGPAGTAPRPTAVVLLAPVTDLRASADMGLGEGAVAAFLGPDAPDERYRAASPLHRLPLGVPQLVVHGDADQRVPVEQSRRYVAAARAAGDPVDYAEVPGLDHFAVIDPADPSWRRTRAWLAPMAARSDRGG